MSETLPTSIRDRYQHICAQIEDTAIGCGRDPQEVRLVVVSKSRPLEVILAAIAAGITIFGENYVDEALGKIQAIKNSALEWHMIGHVQSRKAELVATNFVLLHSLDSLKLARRLELFCEREKQILPVLLEFNVSGEASKYGLPAWEEAEWSNLDEDIEQILALPHLFVSGLMTMPPLFEDAERTRPYFQRLRRLQEFLGKRFQNSKWEELSMGTSTDFVAAIQEGATYVRIGQAILGPRTR